MYHDVSSTILYIDRWWCLHHLAYMWRHFMELCTYTPGSLCCMTLYRALPFTMPSFGLAKIDLLCLIVMCNNNGTMTFFLVQLNSAVNTMPIDNIMNWKTQLTTPIQCKMAQSPPCNQTVHSLSIFCSDQEPDWASVSLTQGRWGGMFSAMLLWFWFHWMQTRIFSIG